MKHIDEYRDASSVRRIAAAIHRDVTRPWCLMEVCGGQTHAIVRFGLDELLPPEVTLIHGPGCPVCVTPTELVDRACALGARTEVTLASFGDMLRVPGSDGGDLLQVKARGGDVRVVYSPLDAVRIARAEPEREVVFFAVGFETTAPANAMAVKAAAAEELGNFTLLVSQVLVPPAMVAILTAPGNRVQAFLGAGHVCTVMGTEAYRPLAERFDVPIVVTGFEPVDLLRGVHRAVLQLEAGRAEVENAYERSVRDDGNRAARELVTEVFQVVDRAWRGIGLLPQSGLGLREDYGEFDAEVRFGSSLPATASAPSDADECRSGEVLQGLLKPADCPAFAGRCTPENPLGATMVSSEGACAAYYRYRRPSSTATS